MALLTLGRVRLRRDNPGVAEVLDEAQAMAAPSGTLQRLGPSCAARVEAAFARGDLAAVRAEVAAASPLAQTKRHRWFIGELAYWQWRAGVAADTRFSSTATRVATGARHYRWRAFALRCASQRAVRGLS